MKKIKQIFKQINGATYGLAFLIILAACINSSFLTLNNLSNVTRQISINGIIAIGMTMVVICGSIDLSVASLYAISGYLALVLSNYSTVAAIIIPTLFGACVGFINALLINKVGMAPMIATLSTQMAIRGILFVITDETSYVPHNRLSSFDLIGKGSIFQYITYPLIIFCLCAAVVGYLLKYRKIGRDMYAVGGNMEAAGMMGISTQKTIAVAHMLCGALTGVAGICLASRLGTAHPLAGDGIEMKAIAATVIGGTLLTGGKGRVSGTMIGVCIMGLLTNIFNMQKTFNTFWEQVITGLLVLTVVVLQAAEGSSRLRQYLKKEEAEPVI